MKKWLQNYIIFIIMLLLALFQVLSGTVLWFVLPHGTGYQGSKYLNAVEPTFGWSRDTWVDWHDWTAAALLAMLIIHLILNWKWIVHTTKRAFGAKA
jgi:cytochrome b561